MVDAHRLVSSQRNGFGRARSVARDAVETAVLADDSAGGHSNAPQLIAGHPEVLMIKADQTSKRVAGEEWHSDLSYDPGPPMKSILYTQEEPASAGDDTMFVNMYAAYETLSELIKQLFADCTEIDDSAKAHSYRATGDRSRQRAVPRAKHPVARTHPVTGRKFVVRQSRLHDPHPAA